MDVPSRSGSYLLLMELARPVVLSIGRLGECSFPGGFYVYTGSAFGPGGLAARLGRHLQPAAGRPAHWHIDYLRRVAPVMDAAWVEGAAKECEWARGLIQQGGRVIAPGFGSSDCRAGCPAHLVCFDDEDAARMAMRAILPCSPAGE